MEATYVVTVDENNCAYFDQVEKLNNYGAHSRDTVSRLLWAFFHYWAYEHDYTRDVISIRTGRIIRYVSSQHFVSRRLSGCVELVSWHLFLNIVMVRMMVTDMFVASSL